MPVRGWLLAVLVASVVWPAVARAQEDQGQDRFFADKAEPEDAPEDATLFQGSLTSTSFIYRETGQIAAALTGAAAGVENASKLQRLFTELRARLDARHISGSAYDFHADARARLTPKQKFDDGYTPASDWGTQVGVYGHNEYDIRELYLRRYGVRTDLTFGRQYVPELATVKIDGVRFTYSKTDVWNVVGFAGLYPNRTSRSVLDDYPKAAPTMVGGAPGKRIMPVAGGIGGAYRMEKMYGSLGAVAILPLAKEQLTGGPRDEQPRVFVTANGYWRRSSKLDIYHFVVLDLYGSNATDRGELQGTIAKIPLTNFSVGVNYRPNTNLRVTAAVNRVDTETLNVIAQTKLEDPDTNPQNIVQNNIEVQRMSQQSARLGVSGAFKQRRFEISASALARSRPEISLTVQPDGTAVTIPAAEALELTLQATDRRSYKGHRISGQYTAILGRGNTNLYRTDANIVRLDATREVKDGMGEYDINLGYITSKDENRGQACPAAVLDPFTSCFGTSAINTVSLSGLFFYRPAVNWFVVVSASAASQGITILDGGTAVKQPRILILTGFLRIARRF